MSTNSNIHKLSSNIGNIPSKHSQAQPQHKVNTVNSQSHSQTKPAQFSVPPRYQPPPHPPGGILKNIPSSKTAATAYQPETSNIPHLNIKYPPEVPKLATVYIPEGVRSSTTRSALPRPSNHRASTGQQYHRLSLEEEHLLRIQNHNQPAQSSEMLKFVRKSEAEGSTAATSNAARLTEQNRHLQSLINELRALKEANQLLSDDNQELRDLCCFLDDDRQKGRKLAREWQRFGRYTASVMRQEVSTYQNKLRQLDDKQQELIRDNLELKELCLYLDEERANVAANISTCTNCGASIRPVLRDDGDGSSSSTNADEPMPPIRQFDRQIP